MVSIKEFIRSYLNYISKQIYCVRHLIYNNKVTNNVNILNILKNPLHDNKIHQSVYMVKHMLQEIKDEHYLSHCSIA